MKKEDEMTKGQAMEAMMYDLLGLMIKDFTRRLKEEPEKIRGSMYAQMISLLKNNDINVQSMSKAKAAQAMSALDDELDWDEWDEGMPLVLPPAGDPVPTRVDQ